MWSAPESAPFRSYSSLGFDLREEDRRAAQRFARLLKHAYLGQQGTSGTGLEEAPELRCEVKTPHRPPGSVLAAPRQSGTLLTRGIATPVHCRGVISRQWEQHTGEWRW